MNDTWLCMNTSETNAIIEDIVSFINNSKEELEHYYKYAGKQLRKNYITKIPLSEYLKRLAKVSVVILTANEYEENILNHCAYDSNSAKSPVSQVNQKITFKHDNIVFDAYLIKINDYDVLHLHAKNTGSYTTGGSSDLVRYVAENEYIYPTCIISFGICFGHSHTEQKIGDTIIAKNLYPYFIGVKSSDGTLVVKSDEFILNLDKTSKDLYEKLDLIIKEGYLDCEEQNGPEKEAYIGNLITGEAVISDETYKKTFEKASHSVNPKGGEMEGYGLGKECLFYNIPCMLIKSICDWGVAKNIDKYIERRTNIANSKDKIQAYTSYCAYTVLNILFNENLFEKSLYHRIKQYFRERYIAENSCFVPSDEVNNVIHEYYTNFLSSKGIKKITDVYVDQICDLMIEDGF